ncbi:MAG: DUF1572 domain-containing protein [Bacteroidetes bacterium]|nr:DUF1572 domain-containing protein [Bacteroidota bacterium]
MAIQNDYLESVRKQFLYYKTLGEKAMGQVDDAQLFVTPNDDSNSIATIVKHLRGNMLSRWTDIFTTDGEKPWRDRDSEFENDLHTRADLTARWNEGWDCFFKTLNALAPEDLERIIYIRNEGHTVMEAINRQLAHYPYHIGQMIYAAKLLKNGGWQSLSIPKNASKSYNADKFSKEKERKNFTDDELNKLNK